MYAKISDGHRRAAGAIAASVALLVGAPTSATEPLQLITPEEYRVSQAAPQPPLTRSFVRSDGPRIIVERPVLGAPVPSPTAIRVRFEPRPGSAVRPETLRVRYGSLRLDVTERLLARYRPTTEGLAVEQAALPAGTHRFLLSIEDSVGRTGEQRIEVEVRQP